MASVLVVETSETVGTLLCDAVKEAGHRVELVGTQREAEELLSANLYDLVISAMVLPDGSGLELAVKSADRGMSTMVTAAPPDALTITRIAGTTHLRKPYNVEEFRNLVANQLGA
jgi:DNA-binding response OmpR family regulator